MKIIMAFIDELISRAKADKKRIVLPEPMDKRTFEAAEKILAQDIADHSCGSKTGKLGQAVEIAQHKDADGDHQRQVTFYHGYVLL